MVASPVVIRTGRYPHRILVEHRESGRLLAHCLIGDDDAVEHIADILSAKRLPREAMRLRAMRDAARRGGSHGR